MKLKVPRGCGGLSHGGQHYPAVKGVVEVPDTATVFLSPGYGCTLISEPAPAENGALTEPKRAKKG